MAEGQASLRMPNRSWEGGGGGPLTACLISFLRGFEYYNSPRIRPGAKCYIVDNYTFLVVGIIPPET